MSVASPAAVDLGAVPPELREARRWVLWRFEERDGRRTKVPVQVGNPDVRASSTDSTSWATFAEATGAARLADGVGFVLGDGYVGVDLDGVLDERGQLVREFPIEDVGLWLAALNGYTEVSPSGRGLHVIGKGELPEWAGRRRGQIEVYSEGRYFTVTGRPFEGLVRFGELGKLAEFCEAAGLRRATVNGSTPVAGASLDLGDRELLERAFAARNGADLRALYAGGWQGRFPSHSEADLALCSGLGFWTGRDPARLDRLFRRSGLMRSKWDTQRGATTYGAITVESALAGRTEFYSASAAAARRPSEPVAAAPIAPSGDSHSSTEEVNSAAEDASAGRHTDLGNAELFAARARNRLLHVTERGTWHYFDGGRYRQAVTGEAERAAKGTVRAMLSEAAALDDDEQRTRAVKHALSSQSAGRIAAMLSLAATEPGIATSADRLDRDPMLLAVGNGTLELRTGKLRLANPADLISMGTDVPFDPAAPCPRFDRFLLEVFAGDRDLVGWLQRFCGYAMTGQTDEQIVAVFHGAGGNGKDTLLRVLERILGDHALVCPFETFTRNRGDRGATNDLARLHKARLVIANESGETARLDEATVKLVSGGGKIAARYLYGEFFEFEPAFQLVLVTNARPRVSADDEAVWRRLREIPFGVSFIGREDKTLATTLEAELPGILTWAVRGCLQWQRDGLGTCAAIDAATLDYRQGEDLLGAFLAERCQLDPKATCPPAELRNAFADYSKAAGEPPLAANVLGKRLAKRGIRNTKRAGTTVYAGVQLSEGEA